MAPLPVRMGRDPLPELILARGAVGDIGGRSDIGDRPCRIRRAFDPNQLRPPGLHRGGKRIRHAGVDKIDD
jgi:hypothetical protein